MSGLPIFGMILVRQTDLQEGTLTINLGSSGECVYLYSPCSSVGDGIMRLCRKRARGGSNRCCDTYTANWHTRSIEHESCQKLVMFMHLTGVCGNKGACICALSIYGTKLCFVGSHLAG